MAGAQIDTASVGYQWIKNQTINGLNIKRSDPEKAFVGDEYLFDEFVARDTHEARLAPAVSTPPRALAPSRRACPLQRWRRSRRRLASPTSPVVGFLASPCGANKFAVTVSQIMIQVRL